MDLDDDGTDWAALERHWRNNQRPPAKRAWQTSVKAGAAIAPSLSLATAPLTIDPATLDGLPVPPRRWLVPNLIPRGAVTLLSGDGGVGKSLLAMQLMTAGALDPREEGKKEKWLGIEIEPFASLGFFCEDDADELHRRQDAINAHYGCGMAEVGRRVRWMARACDDNVMLQYGFDDNAPPIVRQPFLDVEEAVRAHKAELIVIDTVADVFGGNENARAEVRSFVGCIRKLAQINDGAVLLMAHPSVAGLNSGSGLSGSTAWNNSVRSRLYLARPKAGEAEDEPDRRELRGMKSNYAASGAKLALRWQAGAFVREADDGGGMVGAIEKRNLAKKFAELVAIARLRGLDLSPNVSNVYAPRVLAALPEAAGLASRALARGMHQALEEGLVAIEEEGPASKRRRRLVSAA